MGKSQLIYQFKISLSDIEPLIWRRIQVPATYNFWDLHVAIQDSMGWLDYHLHMFRIRPKHGRKEVKIGSPMDDELDPLVTVGWEVPMTDYFFEPGQYADYEYDFGDCWYHEVLLEGILLKTKGVKYPKCIDGERACPPEDCGGFDGYYRFLEILKNPDDEEHEDIIGWLKGHAKNYYPYDPDEFDPDKVQFDNPDRRKDIAYP